MSQDPQLWVVSQALDSVFDVFGEDNCPVTLYQTLGLPSVLKSAASTFKSRVWDVCVFVMLANIEIKMIEHPSGLS